MLLEANSLQILEQKAFLQVNATHQYLEDNNLAINPDKTKYTYFKLKQDFKQAPSVFLGEIELEEVNSAKFLGLHIDNKLSWNNHISGNITSAMTLTSSVRMVRGGKAVQTMYWRLVERNAAPKLIKHGRTFNFRDSKIEKPSVFLQNRSHRS